MSPSDAHHTPPCAPTRMAVLVVALLLMALQVGCMHYPEPRRTYEYLTQYDRMSDEFEPELSLVYSPLNASLAPYRSVIIGRVTVGENWVESPELAQRYAQYQRMLLAQHLGETEAFDGVALTSTQALPGPTMRFEGMITNFDTGSGFMRFFSYFLFFLQSPGATDLQLEGRLYDDETGELLMEFADRRRHLGNTPWLPNPRTFSDEFVMKHTVWETSQSLARIITHFKIGPQPEDTQMEMSP